MGQERWIKIHPVKRCEANETLQEYKKIHAQYLSLSLKQVLLNRCWKTPQTIKPSEQLICMDLSPYMYNKSLH